MKLTKRSPLSGRVVTLDLPITEAEYTKGQEKRRRGALIQEAFPTLSPEHREFILTGIGPEEWDETFSDDADENEDRGSQDRSEPPNA